MTQNHICMLPRCLYVVCGGLRWFEYRGERGFLVEVLGVDEGVEET